LNDEFNNIAFGPNSTNDKYVATAYGDNFAVFEITDRKSTALPQGISAQDQQTAIDAWMNTLPKPTVEQYITIG
jgi:hypothetical protein